MKKTIAVDLDGVIHSYSRGWENGTLYDDPVPGAKEALARLAEQGHQISIVTARLHPKGPDVEQQRQQVGEWLDTHGFAEGKHYHEITNNKPPALAYIDDRAVCFETWEQSLKDVDHVSQKRRKTG